MCFHTSASCVSIGKYLTVLLVVFSSLLMHAGCFSGSSGATVMGDHPFSLLLWQKLLLLGVKVSSSCPEKEQFLAISCGNEWHNVIMYWIYKKQTAFSTRVGCVMLYFNCVTLYFSWVPLFLVLCIGWWRVLREQPGGWSVRAGLRGATGRRAWEGGEEEKHPV